MHCSDNSIVSSGRTKDKEFLIFWSENVGVIDKFCGNGTLLCIDRFHSRDRWPQWGGETIRNI